MAAKRFLRFPLPVLPCLWPCFTTLPLNRAADYRKMSG